MLVHRCNLIQVMNVSCSRKERTLAAALTVINPLNKRRPTSQPTKQSTYNHSFAFDKHYFIYFFIFGFCFIVFNFKKTKNKTKKPTATDAAVMLPNELIALSINLNQSQVFWLHKPSNMRYCIFQYQHFFFRLWCGLESTSGTTVQAPLSIVDCSIFIFIHLFLKT